MIKTGDYLEFAQATYGMEILDFHAGNDNCDHDDTYENIFSIGGKYYNALSCGCTKCNRAGIVVDHTKFNYSKEDLDHYRS